MEIVNEYRRSDVTIKQLLRSAYDANASDLHINAGTPAYMRLHGRLSKVNDRTISAEETLELAKSLLNKEQYDQLVKKGEVDFSFPIAGLCRVRANVFKQRRSVNMVFRLLSDSIPSFESLQLPSVIREFIMKQQGLVLVTGPTGSGKSTTLASMLDYVNETQRKNIITLEDPVEYIHPCKNSIVLQREVGIDTLSFSSGLRAALRQDPDIILVGELRDLETIRTAVTAAETGHLVLGTLHTPDAAQSIDRIIDSFPTEQQRQIRIQLASVLIGVVSQRLVPRLDQRGRALALEILINIPAVSNLIRQEKIYQIQSVIQTNRRLGMVTMQHSLKQLIADGVIHSDALREYEMSVSEE